MSTRGSRLIVRILTDLRVDLLAGRRAQLPHLDHFHHDVDQAAERAHAFAG